MIEHELDLRSGERLITSYAPKFRVFVWREVPLVSLTVIGVTVPVTMAVGAIGLWTAPVVFIAYFFLFDDLHDWRINRDRLWYVTDQRLIQTGDDTETIEVPLGRITHVRRWMWWKVFVQTEGTGLVVLSYVPRSLGVVQTLRTLIQERRPNGRS